MGSNWKKLSGEDNWSCLLDPLDNDLRRYILHYGEMAQATRDAFNTQNVSKHAGDCLYSRRNLLTEVEIEQGNPYKYEVTKYFYGTSSTHLPSFMVKSMSREAWSRESNWIRYVAVATAEGAAALGRRDIVIAWRGTVQMMECINDLKFEKVSAGEIFKGDDRVKIQRGWHSIYTTADPKSRFNKACARDQVLEEVRRLIELHKNEDVSLTVVGHSMGAALATLNAVDVVLNGYNKPNDTSIEPFPVTAFVFASPRVGNSNFKDTFVSLGRQIRVLRVQNMNDLVPHYPLKFRIMWFHMIGYTHIGEVLMIDTSKSPHLKSPGDIQRWHDMETYLHGVAGTQGLEGGFDLVVPRSIALVNKYTDGLNDDCHVPPNWWVLKNKGMVRLENDSWLLLDHDSDDIGGGGGGGDCGDGNVDDGHNIDDDSSDIVQNVVDVSAST